MLLSTRKAKSYYWQIIPACFITQYLLLYSNLDHTEAKHVCKMYKKKCFAIYYTNHAQADYASFLVY